MREIAVVEAVRGGHTDAAPTVPPKAESRAILSRRVRSEIDSLEFLKQLLERTRTHIDAADGLRTRP
jgi:hypothetical protein